MHKITNVKFNMQGNVDQAFADCQDFSEWVKNTVLLTVDKIFTESTPDNRRMVIDNIVLDLGFFRSDEFKGRVVERLCKVLKEKLMPYIIEEKTIKKGLNNESIKLLHDAIYGRSTNLFFSKWSEFYPEHNSELKKILFNEIQNLKVRRIISRQFPASIQNDFFYLLEPSSASFIMKILLNSAMFINKKVQTDNAIGKDEDNDVGKVAGKVASKVVHYMGNPASEVNEKDTKLFITELTLSYISAKRGSYFNRKSYLRNILRNLSAHNNTNYNHLSNHLWRVIESNAIDSDIQSVLLDVLSPELNSSRNNDELLEDTFQEYSWYEKMNPLFDNAYVVTDRKWDEWFGEIKNNYKSLLKRFFRELQISDNMLKNISFSLSEKCLKNLLDEYIQFAYKSPAGKHQSMLLSIDRYAQVSRDVPGFYYQVISALMNNRLLDLEMFSEKAVDYTGKNISNRTDEDIKPISINGSTRNKIKQYLTQNNTSSEYKNISVLLASMLDTDPAGLKTLLLEVFENLQAVKRLLLGVKESLLIRLLQLTGGDVYYNMLPYNEVMKELVFISEFGMSLPRIKCIVWESDIGYLLFTVKDNRRSFMLSQYINQFINTLVSESSLKKEVVLSVIRTQLVFIKTPQNRNYVEHFIEFIDELKSSNEKYSVEAGIGNTDEAIELDNNDYSMNAERVHNSDVTDDSLLTLLSTVFNSRNWSLISSHWERLKNELASELYNVLLQEGQKKKARRHMARNFPDSALHDLVYMLESENIKFIKNVISQHDKFLQVYNSLHENKPVIENLDNESVSTVNVSEHLMEFTFNYLLVERGSKFNQKAYLRSLIRKMSAHYNIDYNELVINLHKSISAAVLENSVKKDLLDALGEGGYFKNNQDEVVDLNDSADNKISTDSIIKRIDADYRVYDRIREVVFKFSSQRKKIPVREWESFFGRLSRNGNHVLERIFREMQLDIKIFNRLVSVLHTDSLFLCITQFMRFTRHVTASDKYALLPAIKQYAEKTGRQRFFYHNLLLDLINNKALNLKSFTELSNSLEEESQDNNDLLYTEKFEIEKIIKYSDNDNLILDKELGIMPELKNTNSVHLSEYLERMVKNKNRLDRMCKLPEYQLCEFFTLVNPSVFKSIISVGERLRVASLNVQLHISPDNLTSVLWKSIAIYMYNSFINHEKYFSLDRYLQIYCSQVYQISGVDLFKIKQAICQQLVLCAHDGASPATDVLISHTGSISEYEIESALSDISVLQGNNTVMQGTAEKVEQSIKELLLDTANGGFESGDMISVGNAGIVLASPYIPLLFERLELTSDERFVSRKAAYKALNLLNYMVYGEHYGDYEGSLLSLILCDLHAGEDRHNDADAVMRDAGITTADKALVDSLLDNIIQQWAALGKTSCDGLRETFLQRQGVLSYQEEAGWKLSVESSAFDVMLDRIPWGYATIRYSFMSELIQVEWRKGGNS